jgi:mono/diheme cytochrome c family protein
MTTTRISVTVKAHWRVNALMLALAVAAFATTPVRAQGPSDNVWVAPERASHRANPLPSTADATKRGHDLFHRDCEQCHGKTGHGDGPQASSLQPRPADLASERVQSQSDGAFFWKMTEGRGVMPKATLGENDKWAVIDYLRTLAAPR